MQDLYEQCLKEEKELVFEMVDQEELIRLGMILYENNKKFAGSLAVRIELNNKEVFSCYPKGTGEFHRLWLRRKARMVQMREMSTLRAFLELKKNGEDLEKDWMLDKNEYAACGGGFPIVTPEGCVVGSVCVSGLPHLEDHRAVIEGLRLFLNHK